MVKMRKLKVGANTTDSTRPKCLYQARNTTDSTRPKCLYQARNTTDSTRPKCLYQARNTTDSTRPKVWANTTDSTPPLFIKVPVPSQESDRSCILCVKFDSFYDFSIGLCNCSDSVIFVIIIFHIHFLSSQITQS